MDRHELLSAYEAERNSFERLESTAKFLLDNAIKRKRIKVHSFLARIKPFDSFADKVERKNARDPFDEIHDILGLRVICLFLSDIEKIGDIIEETFEVVQKQNKIEDQKKDVLGTWLCTMWRNSRTSLAG